ncbi:MAG: energy-coupling factor ABC transporter ATP-binding protein [Planctomycetota bacterium]
MNDPILAVRNLAYRYPDGKAALEGVSFDVADGETVALVGPNGAGKTTLFLCLSGVLPVAPGLVRLAGFDPGVVAERKKLPACVGILFQNSDDQLFSATVGEDVAFGPLNLGLSPAEAKVRVAEALAQAGLPGFENRVPHHLSGGEKRRVALAGLLAMKPHLLLMDEPTMFLDPRGRRDLIRWLNSYPGTKILATHDLDLVLETCSRALTLDGGRRVADGPVQEILGDAALMESHGLEVPYRLKFKS